MITSFIGPAPLYAFLSYCEKSPLEKIILDCGAGGAEPPLAMFKEHGYKTFGIDLSDSQLKKAHQFCNNHEIDLGIIKGDMRQIPFADESMSFAYSYSSICHMTKEEAGIAINEITRVMKKGGLCFISFCSADDSIPKDIESRAPGEYPYESDGLSGIHALYEDTEPDQFFNDFKLLRRERRRVENFRSEKKYAWAEIYYIAQKK